MQNQPESVLTPFANREGAFDPAGWHHLVPVGTFPIVRREGEKSRTWQQVVDAEAVGKIVAAFNRQRAVNPAYKLLIDFEHFSHDTGKSSEAAAWATEVEGRADGVWFRGEWSDAGEAAIRNRRYRYLSPVWFPHQTESLGGNRFRPIAVNDAGLTNKPNLGEALQPFWNREGAPEFPGREATIQTTIMRDKLLVLLGLAAALTDDQLIAAVEAYKNRAAEADALQQRCAALTTEHTAIKNRLDTLLGSSADRVLADNTDLIPEADKPAWRNRLVEDFDGTSALLKNLKRPVGGSDRRGPIHQPGKGAAAAAAAHAGEGDEHPFLNRAAAIATAEKLDAAEAMLVAARRDPALYRSYRESILTPA